MKNTVKNTLAVLLSFYWGNLLGQPLQPINEFTPQLVYNYENKLKIVWPMQFEFWTDRPNLQRISETKGYVNLVSGILSKISGEFQGSDPLVINLYIDEKFSEVKIDKSTRYASFSFRDSLIEFQGKHLLQINDGKLWPVQIYFNDFEHLLLLEKINFTGLEAFVKNDLYRTRSNQIYKTKELIYISNNGNLSRYGMIGRDKLRTFGFQPMFGSMVAYNRFGFGFNHQITLLRYTKGNDNEKHLSSKLAINLKSFIWDGLPKEFSAGYFSAGLEFTRNNLYRGTNMPIDFIGIGCGAYSFEGMNGYNLNVNGKDPVIQPLTKSDNVNSGMYLSFIGELRKFYVSYDLNTGSFLKLNEKYNNSFSSLTLGYKF